MFPTHAEGDLCRHSDAQFPRVRPPPKVFQRSSHDASTSSGDTADESAKLWSTRVAAVATGSQRDKFSALLGLNKRPKASNDAEGDAEKVGEKTTIAESDVHAMKQQLNKMTSDLDVQYGQARAFTHSFRGRGL